jgi:hypothetical protein
MSMNILSMKALALLLDYEPVKPILLEACMLTLNENLNSKISMKRKGTDSGIP